MYKIESIKVAFHSITDSAEEVRELKGDGWEVNYLISPSEAPLSKFIEKA